MQEFGKREENEEKKFARLSDVANDDDARCGEDARENFFPGPSQSGDREKERETERQADRDRNLERHKGKEKELKLASLRRDYGTRLYTVRGLYRGGGL